MKRIGKDDGILKFPLHRSVGGLVFLFSAFLAAPSNGLAQDITTDMLRVGVTRYTGDAHIYLADEKGFFKKNGLNVELVKSDIGLNSVRKMLRGEIDLAMVAATPVVLATLDPNFPLDGPRPDFVILANLIQSNSLNAVIARSDRGIKSPRDLEGKVLALSFNTGSEYYWYTYALFHGIDTSKVRTVHSSVGDLRKTPESGTIDAFTVWEPVAGSVRETTSVPTIQLPDQRLYSVARLVLARRDFALGNVEAIKRYFAALREAEEFLRGDQAEAAGILSRRLDIPEEKALYLLQKMTFNMVLDEALVLNLEAQAKWTVQSKHKGTKPLPDFRALMFEEPLKAAKPTGINLMELR